MTKLKTLVAGISLALFAGSAIAANSPSADDESLLVVFKPAVSKQEREALVRSVGGLLHATDEAGRDLRMRHVAEGRINTIRVANAAQRDRVLKRLSQHPLIEVAEPNYRLTTQVTDIQPMNAPNDEFFGLLWGLHNTGQEGGTPGADISALDAWSITQGDRNIVIGVIDEGIDYNHPDLVANIWHNPGEICDNGIDDTGTGVIDDCHGFDAITGSGDPMDFGGHGTHVAGTIGAAANNGIGVAGVAWDVQLAGCRFLGPDGGFTSDAIACIDYFTNLRVNHGVNIVATNNSWGGGGFSQALRSAIQTHNDAGILFVAAAGNNSLNSDVSPSYPGAYDLPGIINVANTNRTDGLSGTSTYGAVSVDLGAPGSSIGSTYLDGGYVYMSGTSMAAPHVAGAAALLWAIKPDLSITEVKDILMSSGDSIPALAGRTASGKRLNAYQALLAADPDPGFSVSFSPSSQEVSAGDYAQFDLTVASIADWNGDVALSISISPELSYDLSSSEVAAGETVTLTVYTDSDTQWGSYGIELSASDTESGEFTGSASAELMVWPASLVDLTYSNSTQVSIPDNNPNGVTSVISVADSGVTFGTDVSVNITHTWRGDLIVRLTSPEGTVHTLHDRSGGSADDLIDTWSLSAFNGESITGDWTLFVSDNAAADVGRLNSWGLTLSVASDSDPVPGEPRPGFSWTLDGLTASFSNSSSADYDIVSYAWDFGDGATSSQESPVHTYAEQGTYSVSLTVTDSEGQQASVTETLVLNIATIDVDVLSAVKLRSGSATVQMNISGADESGADVYRDGTFIGNFNNGRVRDRFTTSASSVEYNVCPQQGSRAGCTSVTVQF
ncbi:MAG: S8 family serine peptidase [Firmicutes bacterium]|nr:S8 family serine peptidase [Gammaproteobacteria bacterium]MCL5049855.1 S8 family serine peptidase [Bacillota bacterium]